MFPALIAKNSLGLPNVRHAENGSCPRQTNDGVGQRYPAIERRRGAENAVAADQRHVHRLSFRQGNDHRKHRALRQIDMRQRRAGLNQDSFPDQLNASKMRAQSLELGCGQRLQQIIG